MNATQSLTVVIPMDLIMKDAMKLAICAQKFGIKHLIIN